MSAETMPPPAFPRCQIYIRTDVPDTGTMERCARLGTHWVKWSGCGCTNGVDEDCVDDFYSWECDDVHGLATEAA